MSKVKVEGYTDLIRDLSSNAIVNTNESDYQAYIAKYKAREKSNDMLRSTIKEINNLKSELYEIKNLLKKVIEK